MERFPRQAASRVFGGLGLSHPLPGECAELQGGCGGPGRTRAGSLVDLGLVCVAGFSDPSSHH